MGFSALSRLSDKTQKLACSQNRSELNFLNNGIGIGVLSDVEKGVSAIVGDRVFAPKSKS